MQDTQSAGDFQALSFLHDTRSLKSHCPSVEITVTQHPDNIFHTG